MKKGIGGSGTKDRVDRSRGMKTEVTEDLTKIKPTEPLRLAKESERRKESKLIGLPWSGH